MRRAIHLLLALGALSCGPSALRETDTARVLSLGNETSRRIETLTDLEEVRGVAGLGDTVYVATDGGLLRYAMARSPAEVVPGLPSQDVRGVVEDDGALIVATAAGFVRLADGEVSAVEGVPNVGAVNALARTEDGTLWVCGLGGLARRTAEGWAAFGEPMRCTTLAPTPEGQLWVGTASGLWLVEGDVVREHPISGGIPDGYVRAVLPVLPGKILALLDGPSRSRIGYWDGESWSAYTLRGLGGPIIGLARRGGEVLLVARDRVVALAPTGSGVPLVPLSSARGTVRSFRAPITPAAEHTAPAASDPLPAAKPLVAVPENLPTVQAPPFVARALDIELPGRVYASFRHGQTSFLAIANAGLVRLALRCDAPCELRSGSLVPEEHLSIATDGARTTWMLSRDRQLTKYVDGRLTRSALPAGLVAQALATGPGGAYLVALEPSARNAVRIFQNRGSGWQPLAQRTLALPRPLTGVPFVGVAPNGAVWMALRVERDDGNGDRLRGFAVVEPASDATVYHHRGAERPGLPVPDEVSAIDFDTDGNAWIATLSGLVRVGDHQAVVFGEARGVRGEVVTDAAVGDALVWLTSAEGLASYDRTRFDYAQPAIVREARPTRLATDLAGAVWATSANGLLLRQGDDWRLLDSDAGLPTRALLDVEADAAGRVWLLAEDRVLVLTP